jgi:hypothetical protein
MSWNKNVISRETFEIKGFTAFAFSQSIVAVLSAIFGTFQTWYI